jgi:hypothetical protein
MAGPNIETGNLIQFTAADQETAVTFRIQTIVWASFTGSVIVTSDVLNLEDGSGAEVLKLIAEAAHPSPVVVPMGGIVVGGLKAEDLTHGYVHIYGQRM